jgi:hypothetical protein
MTATTGSPSPADNHALAVDRAASTSTEVLEAAVVLESTGVTDKVALEKYGATDVFALASWTLRHHGPGAGGEPLPVGPQERPDDRAALVARIGTRWFYLRGLLYAVPALVALSLLPAGDPVQSGLLLGGLLLSWGLGYGITYIAWVHLGHFDLPAARRFLRRSLLIGIVLATILAVIAVYAALMLTVTMQVTLWTVLLLVGQTAYLLAAITLLMTGHELRLLIALAPAMVGVLVGLLDRQPASASGPDAVATGGGLLWLAASVMLAVGIALISTAGGARPRLPLPGRALASAGLHACYGLMVALLVLYPAANELVNQNFEALPLSVTLAALPLVIGMGVAESLLYRHRIEVMELLSATSSPGDFARAIRSRVLWTHIRFAAALATATVLLGSSATVFFGMSDVRFALLGLDYLVLGVAVFAGMVLNMMGRISTVVCTLGAAVAALALFTLQADYQVADAAALTWYGMVAAILFGTHAVLVRRYVAHAASHW